MSVLKTVSTWRCNCGTHIKVVGERDRNKPSKTVTAACPRCGDKQLIYAERIVSLSDEGPNPVFGGSP